MRPSESVKKRSPESSAPGAARQAGKASFAYAWVLDAHAEERARGVTIDVGVRRRTRGAAAGRAPARAG